MPKHSWPKKEDLTAYHEAGHAAAALILGLRFHHVSILPTCKICGVQSDAGLRELIAGVVRDKAARKQLIKKLARVNLMGGHIGYLSAAQIRRKERPTPGKAGITRLIVASVAGPVECYLAGHGKLHAETMQKAVGDLLQIREALGGEASPNYKEKRRYIAQEVTELLGTEFFWSAVEGLASELIERKYMSYRFARRVFKESLGNESVLFPLFVARRAEFLGSGSKK